MPAPGVATTAGGNIAPRRFVKQSTTAPNTVLQAGAGDKVFGISQTSSRNAPYLTLDDGFTAIAGEPVRVFGPGEIAPLQYGGTVTAGQRLKSDANGKGIATTADGDEYGAVALQSGIADEIGEVRVEIGQRGA
jgi:hypothetical protein